jgi:predicted TIM-barrel fold metal-dependent hydrolase
VASLQDPALDRIFNFAAEVGLVSILHSDLDVPFPKEGAAPAYLDQMKSLLRRHPQATIIWAHTGMGRIVRPVKHHAATVEEIIKDHAFDNVYFDISWDEVAKYFVSSPEAATIAAELINRYPDRFLFGTDEVSPASQDAYLKVYYQYGPIWDLLTPDTRQKVRKGNYERLFDAARRKVRAWEAAHARTPASSR